MYMAETILMIQETFGKLGEEFQPGALLDQVPEGATIGEAAEILGLIAVLDEEQREPMQQFLASIPPAIDVAIVAAIRSALQRGLRAAVSWQPGYEFEVRIWDVSKADGEDRPWRGLVNVHLVSPHPKEAEPF
jgi:hypothetical protein